MTVFFILTLFLKNFDFSKIFLDSLARIKGGSLTTSTYLFFDGSTFLMDLLMLLLEVSLAKMIYLNILLFLLVMREFHPALYMEEINCQTV